jgi:hypothetical protein
MSDGAISGLKGDAVLLSFLTLPCSEQSSSSGEAWVVHVEDNHYFLPTFLVGSSGRTEIR